MPPYTHNAKQLKKTLFLDYKCNFLIFSSYRIFESSIFRFIFSWVQTDRQDGIRMLFRVPGWLFCSW